MRRLFLAAVMSAAALLGSACNGDAGTDKGSGSNGEPAAASSAPAADNTSEVCASVKQLSTEYAAKVTDIVAKAAQDAASGDLDKLEQRMSELTALTTEWAGKIRTEAAKASNPELRQALTELATEVEKVESDDANIDALTGPDSVLVKHCGPGIGG
jgi:hypothetical protein